MAWVPFRQMEARALEARPVRQDHDHERTPCPARRDPKRRFRAWRRCPAPPSVAAIGSICARWQSCAPLCRSSLRTERTRQLQGCGLRQWDAPSSMPGSKLELHLPSLHLLFNDHGGRHKKVPYTDHHVTHDGAHEHQDRHEQPSKRGERLSLLKTFLMVQRTMPIVILDQLVYSGQLSKMVPFDRVQVLKRVIAHPSDFTTMEP